MVSDFSRTAGTTDHDIMRGACFAQVGCGGGRRKAELGAHLGIGHEILIDHDVVEGRNVATQAQHASDIGEPKVRATGRSVRSINPGTRVTELCMTWEEAEASHGELLATIDCLIITTDSFRINRAARRWAIAHGIDAIDAQHYPGATAVEHVVTWPDIVGRNGGCGTCHTKLRLDAYEGGYAPPKDIPTSILAAELSCVQTMAIVAASLHQRAGSTLPIVGIADALLRHPFLLTRLMPSFWSAPSAPFADAPEDGRLFFSRGYALDTPPGWVCPDCGCSRPVEA